MDIYYKIVIGLLLIIVAVLFIRVMQYKRQMRIFADKLKARLDGGVDQDIHVEYFDRDILRLANALNDYSDQIKEKKLVVEKDRARLKKCHSRDIPRLQDTAHGGKGVYAAHEKGQTCNR